MLLILLLLPLASGLEWSEIMFDAVGSDNGKEYIELTGAEDLAGCTITDTQSTDVLTNVQNGTTTTLIVEEDSVYHTGATVYHAGRAIGNGLGNSYERLTPTCGNQTWTTEYNVSGIDGFEPGKSIVWEGVWRTGEPSPGEPLREPPTTVSSERDSGTAYCNTTLLISLSSTSGFTGETVSFSIASAGLASFVATTNGSVLMEGDTLRRDSYSLILPETDVEITAYAGQCEGRQRAKRKILVFPKPQVVNRSVNKSLATGPPAPQEPSPLPVHTVVHTGETVVYERDKNMVPWVSLFGIFTLSMSGLLYWYERRDRA